MQNISEKAEEYRGEGVYPFHMPGHKRRYLFEEAGPDAGVRRLMRGYDYTEIDGFDNLYSADGIIAESQRRAAGLFGADRTFYLVNGSTAGILAAILAAADSSGSGREETGEKRGIILVGPDCHKAVFNALKLGNLTGVTADGIIFGADTVKGTGSARAAALTDLESMQRELDWEKLPGRIERVLAGHNEAREGSSEKQRITAVVITSPNYEGIVSDVERIADIAHRYGAALIVDEAHGTHFGMHPYFPENSNRLGADAVIHSMHKTMTGLTQTALLHLNSERIRPDRALHYLEMIQTSSPSYLLMKSIDDCVALLSEKRDELFAAYVDKLERFRCEMRKLSELALFETEHFDRGKLVVTTRRKNDEALVYAALRDEYRIQPETSGDGYIILMTSFADSEEGFDRLLAACRAIDARLAAETQTGKSADMKTVRKTDCYRMQS